MWSLQEIEMPKDKAKNKKKKIETKIDFKIENLENDRSSFTQ